jgi:hypothetical protein
MAIKVLMLDTDTGRIKQTPTLVGDMDNPMTTGGDMIVGNIGDGSQGDFTNLLVDGHTATVTNSGGTGVEAVWDGSDSTYWDAGWYQAHWIKFAWDSPQEVVRARFKSNLTNTVLESSLDDSTWVQHYSGASDLATPVAISNPRAARYWRVSYAYEWVPQIHTVELYVDSSYPGQPVRLPIGNAGDVLTVVSGFPAWQEPVGGAGSGDATSLQGRTLANTAPSEGQAIVWDAVNSQWEPGTITISGGGGSAVAPVEMHMTYVGSSQSLSGGSAFWFTLNTILTDTHNQLVLGTNRSAVWGGSSYNYDSLATRFECSVAGTYDVNFNFWAQAATDMTMHAHVYDSSGNHLRNYSLYGSYSSAAGNWRIVSGSVTIELNVGERVLFRVYSNSNAITLFSNAEAYMSIVRLVGTENGSAQLYNTSVRELISETVLTSPTNSLTLTGIPQSYSELVLVIRGAMSSSLGSEVMVCLNGDETGANYDRVVHYGGTIHSAALGTGAYSGPLQGTTSSSFGMQEHTISDYNSTSRYKMVQSDWSTYRDSSNAYTGAYLRRWKNNSAVTSLLIKSDGGVDNFVTGSKFSLYGVKQVYIGNVNTMPVISSVRVPVLLSELIVTTSGVSQFVCNVPNDVYDVEIVASIRTTVNSQTGTGILTFNDDTTDLNYFIQSHYSYNAGTSSAYRQNRLAMNGPGATSPAGAFSNTRLFISDVQAAKQKLAILTEAYGYGDPWIYENKEAIQWLVSDPLTKVTHQAQSAEYAVGTVIRAYGYKHVNLLLAAIP